MERPTFVPKPGLIGAAVLLGLSAACGEARNEDTLAAGSGQAGAPNAQSGATLTPGTTLDDMDTTSVGGSDSDRESDAPGDPSAPPVRFDLGEIPDFGDLTKGCGAVDFLFVVDNSGSMEHAQDNLIANFPVFIDGIQSALENVDSLHVGVITTDAYDHNRFGCRDLGSLVVHTGSAECGPYTDGGNFMTEADDLAAAFSCAADVGTDGDGDERPMAAMEAAINASLAGPQQCNEGFLRENALLVVVVISDEWDGPDDPDGEPPDHASPGDAPSWYQAVVDAKGGLSENAAAVVLTNYDNGPCEPSRFTTDYGRETFDGRNLVEFAQLFGANGFVGGICEPDYGPVFSQAIEMIDGACAGFTPPG